MVENKLLGNQMRLERSGQYTWIEMAIYTRIPIFLQDIDYSGKVSIKVTPRR